MFRSKAVVVLGLLLVISLSASGVHAAVAPTFTVNVASTFLHDGPSLTTPRTYSVFQGQAYGITGRILDNTWLQLDFAGATHGTWVPAALGSVTGNLALVPVRAGLTSTAAVTATQTAPATAAPSATVPPPQPVAGRVRLTITVRSLFGLSTPDADGVRVQSLFRGQTYVVRAQSADGQWLRVDYTGATTDVWVPLTVGTVEGDLDSLPVETPAGSPDLETPAPPVTGTLSLVTETVSLTDTEPVSGTFEPTDYPIVPVVSAHAREIYLQGLAMGNDPHSFSKIGDCQNVVAFFLANFDHPKQYRLGADYAALQRTINQFPGSFSRVSESVRGGFNVASVLDPLWTNPKHCRPQETPLDCEFRIHRPSIVFISMETWWADAPAAQYEAALRKIVAYAIAHGAVPILATKADNLEKNGGLNAAIVRVAQDYDVPLWNFWRAANPLPAHGLTGDGFHLTLGAKSQFIFDDPVNMRAAWPWRNLTALEALDAVWQAVK